MSDRDRGRLSAPFSATRRKPVMLDGAQLVHITPDTFPNAFPAVVQPATASVDLAAWASTAATQVADWLMHYRALLFRGFDVADAERLRAFVAATSNGELVGYKDRSSPRHEVADRVYTSTDYPADRAIFFHNEGTYWLRWPLKIYFCCMTPPASGGETPLADCRRVLARLDPAVRDGFREKGIMYVRNFNDGFGLTWQTAFQTDSPADVEQYAATHGISIEWKSDGRLRTRQVRPAIAIHPRTGEEIWFNHAAFFHASTLDAGIRAEFSVDDVPHDTRFGDGSPIPVDVVTRIRQLYLDESTAFRWERGDVLLLDNMSISHGRHAFTGARLVIAAMAEPHGIDGAVR